MKFEDLAHLSLAAQAPETSINKALAKITIAMPATIASIPFSDCIFSLNPRLLKVHLGAVAALPDRQHQLHVGCAQIGLNRRWIQPTSG